jgi:hypothetical protein
VKEAMSDGLKHRIRTLYAAVNAGGDPGCSPSRPGCAAQLGSQPRRAPGTGEEKVTDDGGEGVVRRYYEEALNLGRFDRLDDLLTEEFVDHEELRGIPPTRDGLERKYTMLLARVLRLQVHHRGPVRHRRSSGRPGDRARHP